MEVSICAFQSNDFSRVLLYGVPLRFQTLLSCGFPCLLGGGKVRNLYCFWTLLFFSFSECVGWKNCSVPCTKVPGALPRAEMAVMEPGLASSSGRWLPIASTSPSRQSGLPLISDTSFSLSITDSFSLDFLPFIPSLHEISKHWSFHSWQEVILICEDEVQVQPSLHNLFLIAH